MTDTEKEIMNQFYEDLINAHQEKRSNMQEIIKRIEVKIYVDSDDSTLCDRDCSFSHDESPVCILFDYTDLIGYNLKKNEFSYLRFKRCKECIEKFGYER